MVFHLLSKTGNPEQQRSAYLLYQTPRAGVALTANTWAALLNGATGQRYRVMWAIVSVSVAGIVDLNECAAGTNTDGGASNDFWGATLAVGQPGYFNPFGNGRLLAGATGIGIISSVTGVFAGSIWGFIESTTGPTA